MHIRVPWVFVLTYLVGVGLQFLIPVSIHNEKAFFIGDVAGIVLLAAGLTLAGWGLIIFRMVRTTTSPLMLFDPGGQILF
jgi:hypothetical protein